VAVTANASGAIDATCAAVVGSVPRNRTAAERVPSVPIASRAPVAFAGSSAYVSVVRDTGFVLQLANGTADTRGLGYAVDVVSAASSEVEFRHVNMLAAVNVTTTTNLVYGVRVVLAANAPIDVTMSSDRDLVLVLAPQMETCDRVWITLAYTDNVTAPSVTLASYGCASVRQGRLMHVVCVVAHTRFGSTSATRVSIGRLVDPGLVYGVHLMGYIVQASLDTATVRENTRIHAGVTWIAASAESRRRSVYNVSSINEAYAALLATLRDVSGDTVLYSYDFNVEYSSPGTLYVTRRGSASGVGVLVFADALAQGNYRIVSTDGPSAGSVHVISATTHIVFKDTLEITFAVSTVDFAVFDVKAGPNGTSIVALGGDVSGATTFSVPDAFNVINGDYFSIDIDALDTGDLPVALRTSISAQGTPAIATSAIFFPYHVQTYTAAKTSSSDIVVIVAASAGGGALVILVIVILWMRMRRSSFELVP